MARPGIRNRVVAGFVVAAARMVAVRTRVVGSGRTTVARGPVRSGAVGSLQEGYETMPRLPNRVTDLMSTSLAGPGAVAVLSLAAAGWTASHDPASHPGRFPPCPFRAVTGLACPACGGTRMAHELLHRRWRAAVRANPVLLMIGLPLLGWLWLRWTAAAARGREPAPVPRPLGWAALTVAFAWTVFRNVSPRPR